MTCEELSKSITQKAESELSAHYKSIYDGLTYRIGTEHAVMVGTRHGVAIGAAAVIDALAEQGLLQTPFV